MSRYILLAMVACAPLALTGCYETATPNLYEPGEYKGSQDPLREKLASGDLHSELNERAQRAAQDR